MANVFTKWWNYLKAKLNSSFEEKADPKIQLEQAITEAQEQHRRLREQAANVIANQKSAELKLNRSMEELEKTNANTRQALVMSADALKRGDEPKAGEYDRAAEALATRLIQLEKDIADQKALVLASAQASDQAKAAVQQNAMVLERKLAERQKLLSQLDQAKMQEQLNTAMASLNESVGADVPSFDQVRDKIEARYAKAKGVSELAETSVQSRMIEIEQATANLEAQSRLSQMKTELGLASAPTPAELLAPTVTPAEAPQPQEQPQEQPPA
jgi:phage shock protein A